MIADTQRRCDVPRLSTFWTVSRLFVAKLLGIRSSFVVAGFYGRRCTCHFQPAGAEITQEYEHLRNEHSQAMAQKVKF